MVINTYKVGDKVRCVKNGGNPDLIVGNIYTIENIFKRKDEYLKGDDKDYVFSIEEFPNVFAFPSSYFKCVQSVKLTSKVIMSVKSLFS